MAENSPIDQQVINNNKDIFSRIENELINAEFEVLIATAWFTDDVLFNILLNKLEQGVIIELIIADNQENERLDFGLLQNKGASVIKIKNVGFGMMHQKFCVIDKRIALHGSYNWSLNAKKNNHESIIVTNHKETVEALIENFFMIKNKALEIKIENSSINPNIKVKGVPIEIPLKVGAEYEKVLDSMIAAEIGSFDRKLLREQGFERCSLNNGDHQVLYKAFDTVYSVFINDIDVIEDKKKRLIAKIEEQKVKNIDSLHKNNELNINSLESEFEILKTGHENNRTGLRSQIEVCDKSIYELNKNNISFIEDQNMEFDTQIKLAQREFVTPAFKCFEFIPTVIFNIGLLVYLMIFYSSAAYILLFSVADAKEAELKGLPVNQIQIFNPDAINKALLKSGTAPYFIFLFVFIPLSFALLEKFTKTSIWIKILSFLLGVCVVDIAIAYKVTEAIYNVEFLKGNVNIPWSPSIAFKDVNFYLVFIFGAFGLLLFKFAFDKLMLIFEERNPDIATRKNNLFIKHLLESIGINKSKIVEIKTSISEIEKTIIQHKSSIELIENELKNLPLQLSHNLQKAKSQLISDVSTIDHITEIYKTHVENDNLPISIDSLKDRINIFLEGWNDFLHKEYSIIKATSKTTQATDVAFAWQSEKLSANKIDKRVKIN